MKPNGAPEKNRLLRAREVREMLQISRTTLWRWVECGELPTPLQVGERYRRWREADILEWIEKRGQ